MSDYIIPEVWQNPTSMGGAWGVLTNQLLVPVLNKPYQKAINLSNSIHFQHQMVLKQLLCLKNLKNSV